MELVNARLVTDNVSALAGFYATVLEAHPVINEYYVELPTAIATPAVCGAGSRKRIGVAGRRSPRGRPTA